MPRVRFLRDYNHRWPSRAVSHFRADGGDGNGCYTVKAEVAEAALSKGVATLDAPAAKARHAKCEPLMRMDGRGSGEGRDDARSDELESPDGTGGPVLLPVDDMASE